MAEVGNVTAGPLIRWLYVPKISSVLIDGRIRLTLVQIAARRAVIYCDG